MTKNYLFALSCWFSLFSLSFCSIPTDTKEKYLVSSFHDSHYFPKAMLLKLDNDPKYFLVAGDDGDKVSMLDFDTSAVVSQSATFAAGIKSLFYRKNTKTAGILLKNGNIQILDLKDKMLSVLKEKEVTSLSKELSPNLQLSKVSYNSEKDKLFLYLSEDKYCSVSLSDNTINCIKPSKKMSVLEANLDGIVGLASETDEIFLLGLDLNEKTKNNFPKQEFGNEIKKLDFEAFAVENLKAGCYNYFTVSNVNANGIDFSNMIKNNILNVCSSKPIFKPLSEERQKIGFLEICENNNIAISFYENNLVDENNNKVITKYSLETSALDGIIGTKNKIVLATPGGQVATGEISKIFFEEKDFKTVEGIFYNDFTGDLFIKTDVAFYKVDGLSGLERIYESIGAVKRADFVSGWNKTLLVLSQTNITDIFEHRKMYNVLLLKSKYENTFCQFVDHKSYVCLFQSPSEANLKKIDTENGNEIVTEALNKFNLEYGSKETGLTFLKMGRNRSSFLLSALRNNNLIEFYEITLRDSTSSVSKKNVTVQMSSFGEIVSAFKFNNQAIMCFKNNRILQIDIQNQKIIRNISFPNKGNLQVCEFSEDLETLVTVSSHACFHTWSLNKEFEIELDGFGLISNCKDCSANKLTFLGNKPSFLFTEGKSLIYKADIDNFRFQLEKKKSLNIIFKEHLSFDRQKKLLLSKLSDNSTAVLNISGEVKEISRIDISRSENCTLGLLLKAFPMALMYCSTNSVASLIVHNLTNNDSYPLCTKNMPSSFLFMSSKPSQNGKELIMFLNNTVMYTYYFDGANLEESSVNRTNITTERDIFPLDFKQIHRNGQYDYIKNTSMIFSIDNLFLITNETFGFVKALNFSDSVNSLILEDLVANNLYVDPHMPVYFFFMIYKNGSAKIFCNDYESTNNPLLEINFVIPSIELINDIKRGGIKTIEKGNDGITLLVGGNLYSFSWKFLSVKTSVNLFKKSPGQRTVTMAIKIIERNLIISADQKGFIIVQHSQSGEIYSIFDNFEAQTIQSISYCLGNRIIVSTNKGFYEFDFRKGQINYAFNETPVKDARCSSDYSSVIVLAENKTLLLCYPCFEVFFCRAGVKVPSFEGDVSILGEKQGKVWLARLEEQPSFISLGSNTSIVNGFPLLWLTKDGQINWVADNITINYRSTASSKKVNLSQPVSSLGLNLNSDSCASWCPISSSISEAGFNIDRFFFNEEGKFFTVLINASICEYEYIYSSEIDQCRRQPEVYEDFVPTKPTSPSTTKDLGLIIGPILGCFAFAMLVVLVIFLYLRKKEKRLLDPVPPQKIAINNEDEINQKKKLEKFKKDVEDNHYLFKILEIKGTETRPREERPNKIIFSHSALDGPEKKGSYAKIIAIELHIDNFHLNDTIKNSSAYYSKTLEISKSANSTATSSTGILCAVKLFHKEYESYTEEFQKEYENYKDVRKRVADYNKSNQLSKQSDPINYGSFLQFYGVAMSQKQDIKNGKFSLDAGIILEYVDSTLTEELLRLPPNDIKYRLFMSIEICIKAMLFSKIKLVHCDLKRDNILISRFGKKTKSMDSVDFPFHSIYRGKTFKSPFSVKICDYGSILPQFAIINSNEGFTPKYMPPEVKKLSKQATLVVNSSIDIYSTGIILKEDIFKEISEQNAFFKRKIEPIIANCLTENPAERLKFENLVDSLLDLRAFI